VKSRALVRAIAHISAVGSAHNRRNVDETSTNGVGCDVCSPGQIPGRQLIHDAQGGAHRLWLGGQDDAVSAHDERSRDRTRCLDRLTALYNPRKRVPATVEFSDLAVQGRAAGAQTLVDVAAYRNADALVHVLRAFADPSVPYPPGAINPARDAQAMEDELILADLGVAERRLERLEKDLKKSRSQDLERERDVLMLCTQALEGGRPLRALALAGEDSRRLRGFQFLSAKPVLLVINLDESQLSDGADSDRAINAAGLTEFVARAATAAAAVCARIELEIAQLEPADAAAFLADLSLAESGLDRVIRTTYDLLGYISFFTVGDDECRAWSVPRGTSAQLAAGEIHSDIARGFIRAEVVSYEALISRGSMPACRDYGEVRLEGKEYIVQDGDIINFRFAT
jgi:GTP-binding protein YchF